MDISPPQLGGLVLCGHLDFSPSPPSPLELKTDFIHIDGGQLSIGAPDSRYQNRATITLTGNDPTLNVFGTGEMQSGTKVLLNRNGGRLAVWGAEADWPSWVQLDATALVGSHELLLDRSVPWRVGDDLALATSSFRPEETEIVTIAAITGAHIWLQQPLAYTHGGERRQVAGHWVDQRAEVARLTRNIEIRGDINSEASGFGGHLMMMAGTDNQLHGITFRHMGQVGRIGRYPMHWHLAGDQSGDAASGNAIVQSFHRAVAMHGTHGVSIENNCAVDIQSHAFVPSERGDEVGNVFRWNLAMQIRRLDSADYAFPSLSHLGGSSQSEFRPAGFWMRNPDQVVEGNHVAGVYRGVGVYVDGPSGPGAGQGIIRDNTAHGCWAPSGTLLDRYPPTTAGYGFWAGPEPLAADIRVERFTAYHNSLSGLWLETAQHHVLDSVLAHNGTGALLFSGCLERCLVLGSTETDPIDPPKVGIGPGGGVHLMPDHFLKRPLLRDVTFVDQADAAIVVLDSRLHPGATVSGLRFSNTLPLWVETPEQLRGGLTDLDGCLAGDGVPAYYGGRELLDSGLPVFHSTFNTWCTPLEDLTWISLSQDDDQGDLGFVQLAHSMFEVPLISAEPFLPEPARYGYVPAQQSYRLDLAFDRQDGLRIDSRGQSIHIQMADVADHFVYAARHDVTGAWLPDFAAPVSSNSVITLDPETRPVVFRFDRADAGLVLDRPFAMWRTRHIHYRHLLDPLQAGKWTEGADPDGDALNNEQEFLHATDPLRPSEVCWFDPFEGRFTVQWNQALAPASGGVWWRQAMTAPEAPAPRISVESIDAEIVLHHHQVPAPTSPTLFMGVSRPASGNR